jgi:FtsP/CotA-like multicopper oxidase with cupredoxin domain
MEEGYASSMSARLMDVSAVGGSLLCGMLLLSSAYAEEPVPFDPTSTPAAPCGVGVPPPGHLLPELTPGADGLSLTVRQDGDRLCYSANGSSEAPVIRVRRGSSLTITLRNEISEPARIDAVTGPGKLTILTDPVPRASGFYPVIPGMNHAATGMTNLHVHGFAVPPVSPQDDVLTLCTDPAVGPARCGRREFTYRYQIPEGMPEGLYWYHPHVHGEVQAQMLMGLTGAIVVEGPQDDTRRAAGIADRVLIVRQVQDQDAGKTRAQAMTAAPPTVGASKPSMKARPATQIDTAHELLCGSGVGIDAISLNGTPVPIGDAPDGALAHFTIPEGRVELWRLLNAATDAFLDLALIDRDGAPLPITIIARDGSPLTDDASDPLPREETRDSQSVPPSGRIEFLVRAPPAGHEAYLVTHAVDTGCAGDRLPERRLAVLSTTATDGPPTAQDDAASTSRKDLFSGLVARHTDRRRIIAMAEYPRPGVSDQVDFYLVERKPGAILRPYHMGDPPMITVKAGTTEEWTIENWTQELHAFHIHQVHFRVLRIDGEKVTQPPLLDVVTIPYATATGYHSKEGPVRPGRVRIKLTFPASLAGDIPFHCHLVDHEDNGMMAVLRVLRPAQ